MPKSRLYSGSERPVRDIKSNPPIYMDETPPERSRQVRLESSDGVFRRVAAQRRRARSRRGPETLMGGFSGLQLE